MTMPIDNHADLAVARLPSQLKGVLRLVALIRMFGAQVQELEDALEALFNLNSIDDSEGLQLDRIGGLLKESRDGSSDPDYRPRLKARIKLLRSSGTVPELLSIFRLLVDESLALELDAAFPAGFQFTVAGGPITSTQATILRRILGSTRAGGVRGVFQWQETDDAHAFSFEDGPGLGFGDTTNPATGGAFTGALDS